MKKYKDISEDVVVNVSDLNVRFADLYSGIADNTDRLGTVSESQYDIIDRVENLEEKKKGFYIIAVNGFTGEDGVCNSDYEFVDVADLVLSGLKMETELNNFAEEVPEGSILLFAPGRYFFAGAIKLNKRITLAGMNKGAVFYGRSTNDYIVRIGSNDDTELNYINIANIYFNQNEESTHETGMVYARNVNGLRIAGCSFAFMDKDVDNKNTAFIHLSGYVVNAVLEANVYNSKVSDDITQELTINGEKLTETTTICIGVSWNKIKVYDPHNKMSVMTYGLYGYEKVSE